MVAAAVHCLLLRSRGFLLGKRIFGHCSSGCVGQVIHLISCIKVSILLIYVSYILTLIQFQETPDEGGWHDLVAKGYIEYIDTEEEETTMIAMTINVSIVHIIMYPLLLHPQFLSCHFHRAEDFLFPFFFWAS